MDTIANLLPQRKYEEPPEVQIIKAFVMEKFQQTVNVAIKSGNIIIQVKGAALAGALRPHLHELQDLCQTDQRLVLRIG